MNDKLKKIKALFLDVDGVLTDGKIIFDSNGNETKFFDVQDGLGIVCWQKMGFKLAIISSRASDVITHRARDLSIEKVYMGIFPKVDAYVSLLKEFGVSDEEVCFVGDDLADLGILKRVGFSVAVPNAVHEVKQISDYVTQKPGGQGAVREVIELILKAKGEWDKLVAHF